MTRHACRAIGARLALAEGTLLEQRETGSCIFSEIRFGES